MRIFHLVKGLPASANRLARVALFMLPVTAPALGAQSPSAPPRLLRAGDLDTIALRDAGRRIAYGDDSLQFGELRLPPKLERGARAPVAVIVHGGCWIAAFATVRNTAALADSLAAEGVATWNVEYRRSDSPGGGWPGTMRDVAQATDYLRTLVRQYPLDTARVVAVGHSAGGQLALWLASRATLPATSPFNTGTPPLRLTGVVSLGGITDLTEFAQRQANGCGRGVAPLLGGAPGSVPERVALASPVKRLPLRVPVAHVAGAQDGIAPDSVRRAFLESAWNAGDLPSLNLTVPGGHFEVIAPRTPAGAAAMQQVVRLLTKRAP